MKNISVFNELALHLGICNSMEMVIAMTVCVNHTDVSRSQTYRRDIPLLSVHRTKNIYHVYDTLKGPAPALDMAATDILFRLRS